MLEGVQQGLVLVGTFFSTLPRGRAGWPLYPAVCGTSASPC